MIKAIPGIVKWWVTPKLPLHYYSGGYKGFIFHPIKRRIAKFYVWFLQNVLGTKVIGITGSVGKTTAKEMILSILSQKFSTISSYENIDPVFNIPTTILKSPLLTRMLVLEMGVEYEGDMDFYNWIVQPDIGVLINIYWTHTEFLEGIDGVQKEKGKLIKNLPKNGYAILNVDDPRVKNFEKNIKAKVLTFGINKKANVMAKKIRIDKNFQTKFEISINGKSCRITIPVLGKHFVYSVLAAAAVGYSQKIPFHLIENGFKLFKKLPHRMTPIKLNSGAVILDDTYNSNPLGAKAAIDVLSEIGKGKKKIAVLGDMLELGSYTEAGHEEVGEYAAKKGIDTLVCIGDFANFLVSGAFKGRMNKKNVLIFPHKEEAKTKIKELVYKNSFVLFKASRKLKFEDLVNYLRE